MRRPHKEGMQRFLESERQQIRNVCANTQRFYQAKVPSILIFFYCSTRSECCRGFGCNVGNGRGMVMTARMMTRCSCAIHMCLLNRSVQAVSSVGKPWWVCICPRGLVKPCVIHDKIAVGHLGMVTQQIDSAETLSFALGSCNVLEDVATGFTAHVWVIFLVTGPHLPYLSMYLTSL